MSATLLNAQLFQPPGAAGIGGAVGAGQAQGLAGGAAAGFEALVAALFGQGAATDATATAIPFQALVQASAPGAATAAAEATPAGDGKGATGGDKAAKGEAKSGGGETATPDAALALLAAGAAQPVVPAPASTTAAATPAAGDAITGDTVTGGGAKTAAPAPLPALDPAAAACAADAKALPLAADPTATAPAADAAQTALAQAATPATPAPTTAGKPAAKAAAAATDTTPAATPDPQATPAPAAAQADTPPAAAPEPPTPVQTAAQSAAQSATEAATQAAPLAQPAPAEAPQRTEPAPSNHRAQRDKAAGRSEVASLDGAKAAPKAAPHARLEGAKTEAPPAETSAVAGAAADDADDAATDSSDAGRPSGASDTGQQQAQATQSPQALHAQQAAVRGAPQTVANLAAQIVKKLDAKTTRFDVQLDPAGLGKVDVRVEIGAEGRITAALACHSPEAAKELQARSGELQKALEQAGFDVSGGLSFEMAGGGNGQAGAGQNPFGQQNDSGSAFRGRAFATALETAGDAAQAAAEGALRLRLSRDSGVDIRI